MRKIFYTIMAICLSIVAIAQTTDHSGSSITIERLSGKDLTFALAQVGKLTFANDSVYLMDREGVVLGKEAQNQTQKIVFGESKIPLAASEVSDNLLRVYPNPTADHLIVSGLEDGATLRVYTREGKLLETATAQGNTATLQVSHLAQGTYLLQINTTVVKFIKQ